MSDSSATNHGIGMFEADGFMEAPDLILVVNPFRSSALCSGIRPSRFCVHIKALFLGRQCFRKQNDRVTVKLANGICTVRRSRDRKP